MDLLKVAQDALAQQPKEFPNFKAGDTVTVTYVIKEENKEFMGTPIQPLRQYLVSNARFRHIDEMARKLEKLEKELAELKGKKEGN